MSKVVGRGPSHEPHGTGGIGTPAAAVTEPLQIYLRQGFTNSSPEGCKIVQSVIDILNDEETVGLPVRLLTGVGPSAAGREDFRLSYERFSGKPFTPKNFREERLKIIDRADGMVIVRTCLSESTAFEIAYNVYSGRRSPIFFAIHKSAPITTTLLRDLDDLLLVRYVTFTKTTELSEPLTNFLQDVAKKRTSKFRYLSAAFDGKQHE